MFTFLCKQNQHNEIARLIHGQYGIKPRVESRGSGVLVSFQPPKGVSNRKVDQLLYSKGVAGSRSRRNKLPIFSENVSAWDLINIVGWGAQFIVVRRKGKRRRLVKSQLVNHSNGCTCCGPIPMIVPIK